jgi:AcrR family transcriptional regulator
MVQGLRAKGSVIDADRYDVSYCSHCKLAFLSIAPGRSRTMKKAELQPRKAPRQARSQDMVQTLLTAATRVLARESLQGFNTNRVAEVAGVSVGSLYQYFPNKNALVAALIEQAQTELAQAVESAVQACAGQPLREALAALVDVAIQHQYGQPLLAAALDHEERRLPLQTVLSQAEQRLGGAVLNLLQRHATELAVSADARSARDCLIIAKALVEADAFVASRTRAAPPPDLPQRVQRALLGYLCGSDARP